MARIHEGNTGSRDGATSGAGSGTHVGTGGRTQVRQVQEALKAQGHDPGAIDGVMGPQTQEALRAYQRSQNLTETGRLDAQTTEKLASAERARARNRARDRSWRAAGPRGRARVAVPKGDAMLEHEIAEAPVDTADPMQS